MNSTPKTTIFDPKAFAAKISEEMTQAAKEQDSNEDMLNALQSHYNTLHKNQEMYISYLTEFVEKLKEVQRDDKESFTNLKKEVIKHVLDSEKKRVDTQRV
ncbi:MAG: hypothetical protein RJB39_770 [Candidatus Parcubacteria bacterium]|jgi:predicted  nucleic acid-binding Zn-ribbon protein